MLKVGFLFLRLMGLVFYRLSVFFYFIAIRLAAPFNNKARLFTDGRKNTFPSLEKQLKENNAPIIWVHCASLGEFEQGKPVIERLAERYPSYKILLTFFSPSGYEVRSNYIVADLIHYLPLDTPSNSRRFIELTRPSLVIFVKYEFWYFYLKELDKRSIPTLSISSIFRPNQIFFKGIGGFQRKTLKLIDHFFVQTQKSSDLLLSIDVNQVTVSGDTRFDRVYDTCQNAESISGVSEFIGDSKTMIIGSSWPEDMEILNPFIESNRLKYIIAPHEISESGIEELIKGLKKPFARYSDAPSIWQKKDVLIIDNVGLLSRLYRYGDYAYVGGAFGKGLHNTLEAATFGLPIFFGNKNYTKFQEAIQLTRLGAAFPIGSYRDLQTKFDNLSEHVGPVARNFVEDNLGATEKIMAYLNGKL